MKLNDYGEDVCVVVKNMLAQQVATERFDNLYKAWEFGKPYANEHSLRFIIKKNKSTRFLVVRPFFKNSSWVASNGESSCEVKRIDHVYDALGKLYVALNM